MTATDHNTAAASEFLGEEVVIAIRVSAPTKGRVNRIRAVLAPLAFVPFFGVGLAAAGSIFSFVTRRSNGSGTMGRQLLAFTHSGGRVLIDTDSPILAFGRETPTGIPRRLSHNADLRVSTDDWEHLTSAWPVTVDGVDLMVDGVDFKRLLKTVFEHGHELPALRAQLARHYRKMRVASAGEPEAIRLRISDEELRRRKSKPQLD